MSHFFSPLLTWPEHARTGNFAPGRFLHRDACTFASSRVAKGWADEDAGKPRQCAKTPNVSLAASFTFAHHPLQSRDLWLS